MYLAIPPGGMSPRWPRALLLPSPFLSTRSVRANFLRQRYSVDRCAYAVMRGWFGRGWLGEAPSIGSESPRYGLELPDLSFCRFVGLSGTIWLLDKLNILLKKLEGWAKIDPVRRSIGCGRGAFLITRMNVPDNPIGAFLIPRALVPDTPLERQYVQTYPQVVPIFGRLSLALFPITR
jgi:hypothetical protein